MDASTLRQFWSLIEETQVTLLLRLSDSDLVKYFLRQLSDKAFLNGEQMDWMSTYIYSKTALIRDLADARSV
jgi:hypothetical protein